MVYNSVTAITQEEVTTISKKTHRISRKAISIILVIELIALAAECYAAAEVYRGYVVWLGNRAICRNLEPTYDNELFSTAVADAAKVSRERIVEEVDEIVWTTDSVAYRKGPDKSYKKLGTLDSDRGIRRTGITWNKWSLVTIDDTECYIPNSKLTSEPPVSAIIEGGQKGEYQKYALSLFPDFGWSSSELQPLINLWNRESHWNPGSHNGRTGAHGIPQAVPASKMSSEGSDYYSNGYTQIRWGLKYIRSRYGSPSAAWAKFTSSGWY